MITIWSEGDSEAYMPAALSAEMSRAVHTHPWWQARARLTLALLERNAIVAPARVLDAGCGWGVTLEALERRGYRVTGLDVARKALERLDRPGRDLIEADLVRPFPQLTAAHARFDAVLALDVLEHLDDDRAGFLQLLTLVRSGGLLIVSVPALRELFSEFDQIQGHRRRYQPQDLKDLIEGSGRSLEKLFWWGSWLVPVFRSTRTRRRTSANRSAQEVYRAHLKLPPWPLSGMLRIAFAWEQHRALRGALKRGTSLVAVARKTHLTGNLENRRSLAAAFRPEF
jgi:SAM-dependent methyltransferase